MKPAPPVTRIRLGIGSRTLPYTPSGRCGASQRLVLRRGRLSRRVHQSHTGGTSSPVTDFHSKENGPSQSFTLTRRKQYGSVPAPLRPTSVVKAAR